MNEQELLEISQKHAASHNEMMNNDKGRVKWVLQGLLANRAKYGELYCPCRARTGDKAKDKKIICPCLMHTEEVQKHGHCLCNFFLRKR